MNPQHALRYWPHCHVARMLSEFKPFIHIVPQLTQELQAHVWMLPALIIWGPLYLSMPPQSQLEPMQLCHCQGNGRHLQGLNRLSCGFYLLGAGAEGRLSLFSSHLLVWLIPPGDCEVMLDVAGSGVPDMPFPHFSTLYSQTDDYLLCAKVEFAQFPVF